MKYIKLYEAFVNESSGFNVLVYTHPSLDTEPINGTEFRETGYADTNLIDGGEADTAVIIVPKTLAKNQKAAEKLVQKHYADDFANEWMSLR